MPYWRTYYHLVWATKEREPLITPEVEKRLYAYLIRKAAEIGVRVYAINGGQDHVHLVVSIPPSQSIADVVHRLKGASSHDLGMQGVAFEWQRGYGVLTMGEKQRSIAEDYVLKQKAHHANKEVNTALERCAEQDEGPSDAGISANFVPAILREEQPPYAAIDESPF